ncbi:hypothetical protein RHOSPDRAFT_32421 [Rhodotorula sp. JG-1b]|nr:hypothetical protein RHOSPDRAFT_32421 [Rhodotorula sp. JG-1b]
MTPTLRPVQRLLHTARPRHARLIGSNLSVSPDFANAPPPPVPTVAQTAAPRQLRPIDRQGKHAQATETKTAPQSRAPEATRPTSRTDDGTTTPGSPVAADRGGKADTAESVQDRVSAAALEAHLLRTLAQLHEKRRLGPPTEVGLGTEAAAPSSTAAWVDLPTLARQKRDREGHVVAGLAVEYEPTPGPSRRLRLDGSTGVQQQAPETVPIGHDAAEEQDGIVIVAHVLGGENPRVSICSGFAVGKPDHAAPDAGEGQVILTCAHTLDSIEHHLTLADATAPSATFVLAQSGHVYTVQALLSSITEADLLLLRLSPDPINPSALPLRRLRSLPINPYPAPVSTSVAVHRYLNPLSRLRRKLQKLPEREWDDGTVREYKDPIGRTAEPGTYDALHSMWLSCAPTSGSSGGPVIDRTTGSVIGVTRGSTHKYGERQEYGFATPSERIFEMFRLPGFKTTAEREAERLASGGARPSSSAGNHGAASTSSTTGSTRKA